MSVESRKHIDVVVKMMGRETTEAVCGRVWDGEE